MFSLGSAASSRGGSIRLAGDPRFGYLCALFRTGSGANSLGSRHIFEALSMSRVCQVTGKRPKVGNTVSHANNRKRRRFLPNLHTQRFWLESERRFVTLRVSTRGLRTIEKRGVDAVVADLRAQGLKI